MSSKLREVNQFSLSGSSNKLGYLLTNVEDGVAATIVFSDGDTLRCTPGNQGNYGFPSCQNKSGWRLVDGIVEKGPPSGR